MNFENSTVTITGGTGSFGSTMVRHLLSLPGQVSQVRVFSRDETKQDLLRYELKDKRVRFYLGDVRDIRSVQEAIRGSDYVFHAAALKQVPSCEFFPSQAVETNILGSRNVIDAAIENSVKSVVCLSTDKAVYPINAMGMSKALMEKQAQSYVRTNSYRETTVSITRYGNVMLSRGSVIPLFVKQLKEKRKVTITDPEMTRFLMSLEESVELVLHSFLHAEPGDLFIRKAPASSILVLAEAVAQTLELKNYKQEILGIRHGEKINESLLSTEEMSRSIDSGRHIRIPIDTRTLNYEAYFNQGTDIAKEGDGYTSKNTEQLNVSQVAELLMSLPTYKKLIQQ
jgi:UDP-N-acetylglucosamine 4,6-dehydratase